MIYISLNIFHFLLLFFVLVLSMCKNLNDLSGQVKLFLWIYFSFLNERILMVNISKCMQIKITFRMRNDFRGKSRTSGPLNLIFSYLETKH